MAKVSDLTSLFHAISAGDWPRARAVAQAIIEREEQAGHHSAAQALRGALVSTGPRAERRDSPPSAAMMPALPEILTPLPPAVSLAAVELRPLARQTIEEVIKEYRHKVLLAAHELRIRNRLFFYGPPGCGKTLTARAIGKMTDLPVLVVRFDALVGSYLGQTSVRIRDVFHFAEVQPCVMLIDEIDAVGRRRGSRSDVGELDRIVISLMQQLDLVSPAGFVIATSNVPGSLDVALLRRFDLMLSFPLPNTEQINKYVRAEAPRRSIEFASGERRRLARANTYAEAHRLIDDLHRKMLMRGL